MRFVELMVVVLLFSLPQRLNVKHLRWLLVAISEIIGD